MKKYIIVTWLFAEATVGPAKLLGLAYCDNSVREKRNGAAASVNAGDVAKYQSQ